MNIRTTTRNAALAALVSAATLLVQVPVPATQSYIHLGDAAIIAGALLFGARSGLIAGGIGSVLADILGGYAHWAPFTLIIKGLEGFLVGLIAARTGTRIGIRTVVATTSGGVTVVAGYFLVETTLYGSEAAVIATLPNTIQALSGMVAGVATAAALHKAGKLNSQHDRI
jgi:uncharacterized membrane protein